MFLNIKKVGNQTICAICDAEILGKTFKDGEIVFHVNEQFYKGQKMSIEKAFEYIENSTIVNMAGRNIVRKAIEKKYVHPEAILNIGEILHAQIIKF